MLCTLATQQRSTAEDVCSWNSQEVADRFDHKKATDLHLARTRRCVLCLFELALTTQPRSSVSIVGCRPDRFVCLQFSALLHSAFS